MNRRLCTLAVVLWGLTATACGRAPASAQLQPFTTDSMTSIETRYQGQAFIVALWALDCAPCLDELALLGDWRKENPEIPLVLVATDQLNEAEHIQKKLEEFDLTGADNWHYAESYTEKLRFSIDPTWRGELPRSYLYFPNAERRGISGKLTKEMLMDFTEKGPTELGTE